MDSGNLQKYEFLHHSKYWGYGDCDDVYTAMLSPLMQGIMAVMPRMPE